MIRWFHVEPTGPPPCSDSDAQAFIVAADITDPTQQGAICQLVKDLKGVGSTTNNSNIWSKFTAIYPLVGGTADQHKWNLKNTSTFTMNWIGSVPNTHDINGVEGTGNGFGDTTALVEDFIDASGVGGVDVILSPDYTAATDQQIGKSVAGQQNYYIRPSRTATTSRYSWGAAADVTVTNSDSDGLHGIDFDGTNSRYYRNTTVLRTDAPATFNNRNVQLYFMAAFISPGAARFIQAGIYGQWFAMRNGSITGTERQDYFDAVDKFQTAIGR